MDLKELLSGPSSPTSSPPMTGLKHRLESTDVADADSNSTIDVVPTTSSIDTRILKRPRTRSLEDASTTLTVKASKRNKSSTSPPQPFKKLSFACLPCIAQGVQDCIFQGWKKRCSNCEAKKRGNCTFKHTSVQQDRQAAREFSQGSVDEYRDLLRNMTTLNAGARAAQESARHLLQSRDLEAERIANRLFA
ncbi:hypothetical protein D9758_017647 [Tetrapyrgos nigripes]|uniref:Uncharacterized protein n=1 Tax=Tetrapyrgos nigripes TaxID=182062 RepID=A0A8H5FLK1_9AGAR|nr:hypothetical protein D9758_017647 [Tetrapyrgos nigripes]